MVNFLALEYRDDGGKPWRLGCLECLEHTGHLECLERLEHTGRSECMERLAFVQSVIFGKVNDS